MKLSVKSEYACLALIFLCRKESAGYQAISVIAEEMEIPRKFLEQILLALKRASYVKSKMGPEGGYQIAKKPSEISLADIVRLMDGALAPVSSVSHYFYEPTPIEKSSSLLNVFSGIRDYISKTMEETTFDKLLE